VKPALELGGRFDRSGHATNANLTGTGWAGILTYWPKRSSRQIRTQYRLWAPLG